MAKQANIEGFGGLILIEMDFDPQLRFILNRKTHIRHNNQVYEPVRESFYITGLAEEIDPTTSVQMVLNPAFQGSDNLLNNPVPPTTVRIILLYTQNYDDNDRFAEQLIHEGILTNGRVERAGVTFNITPEDLGASEGSPEFYIGEDHKRKHPLDKSLDYRRDLAGKERRAPS